MPFIGSARSALISILRHRGASLVAVGTLAFMLSALTVFILVADGMDNAASNLESKANLIVDLQGSVTPGAAHQLAASIERQYPHTSVTYISQSQAAVDFRKTFADNTAMLSALQGNPLPASLQVRTSNPAALNSLAKSLHSNSAVNRLIFNPDLTRKLVEITTVVRLAGASLVIGLAALSLIIVVNTTHLTVESRRNEIEVMRLIGATHAFVRNPLIAEGVLLGMAGALVAITAGLAFYLPTMKAILMGSGSAALALLPINTSILFLTEVVLAVLIAGAAIGAAGSYISVRRFAHF